MTYACKQTGSQTITLLDDADWSGRVNVNDTNLNSASSITVNLGGHTLTCTGMSGSGRVKALQVLKKENFTFTINGGDGTDNDTTVGTIVASSQGNGKYERFFTTYTNFVMNNVTLDGSNLSAQIDGEDCAVICHSYKTLTLKGNTSIITRTSNEGEPVYAVAGRVTDNYGNGDFKIVIDTTSDTPLEYVGLYKGTNRGIDSNGKPDAWGNSKSVTFANAALEIKQGNVGEITYGENVRITQGGVVSGSDENSNTYLNPANDTYVKTNTKISAGAVFTSEPTAYASFVTEGDNKASFFAYANGKYYATDSDGWYGTSGTWNYITAPTDGSSVASSATATLAGASGELKLTNADGAPGISFNSADSVTFGSNISGYKTFNAGSATAAVTVTGNDYLTKITGGAGADLLKAGIGGVTLEGGESNDTLVGSTLGSNTFGFSGGADSISNYVAGDVVTLGSNVNPTEDGTKITHDSNAKTFAVAFGEGNTLTFDDTVEANVRSDRNSYVYAKDFLAFNKSVTLAAGRSAAYTLGEDFSAVDATAVTLANGIALTGNKDANTLVGSNAVANNTLDGGAGNDLLKGYGKGDVFVYAGKGGKDTIEGFVAADKLSVEAGAIKSGSMSRNGNLIFKVDNSNTITFTGGVEKVQLQVAEGAAETFLTKDGTIADNTLTLFAEQKGRIDLADDTVYSGVTGIDASAVTKSLVTMVGGANGGTFTFGRNSKADVFEYGGGAVTLNGYVGGSDKMYLSDDAIQSFSVDSISGVNLTLGDNKSISLAGEGFNKKEVLIRDTDSNSYKKMVFAATGVLYDKANNAAQATIFSGAGTNNHATVDGSIKKINVAEGVTNMLIEAGNKNNTVIDASSAGAGVSLQGGEKKNDKLTGNDKQSDVFIFTGGKDVITNYASGDSISAAGFNLGDAKITQSSRSVTFKFDNKSKLTVKTNGKVSDFVIDGQTYGFGKNAIITGSTASLTSEFSGTYKASKGITVIDGKSVEKNFTIQGTSNAESIHAGEFNKKTTLKGGGGADTLVGGASADTFFYAKSDKGDTQVYSFDYASDQVKMKGTITGITKASDGLKFTTSGGSLTLKEDDKGNNIGSSNVLIKANNMLYWFATVDGNYGLYTSTDKDIKSEIKSVMRNQDNYSIVDLNYSTNLVKNGLATASETVTFNASNYEKK